MALYDFSYTNNELLNISNAWAHEMITKPNKNTFLNTHVLLPKLIDLKLPPKYVIVADIGGTFLKLCTLKVGINGDYEYIKQVERTSIAQESQSNNSIWMLIAMLLKMFMVGLPAHDYVGSLTVSFPMEHTSISSGRIIDCGKNFKFEKSSFIGSDPVKAVNDACEKTGVKLKFLTVMNDATATAVASYFAFNNTILGIVLGTGTNGAFIEDYDENYKTVINSEWAAFDHSSIKRTVFDEIIINGLRKKGSSFNLLDVLLGGFKVVHICKLAAANEGIDEAHEITLKDMLESISPSISEKTLNLRKLKECCSKIQKRRNQVLAALIIGTLKSLKPKEKDVVICLNGSIFEYTVEREQLNDEVCRQMENSDLQSQYNIRFHFICDGSLLGCAFSVFL